ncbi:Lysophospholipase L1 [Lachnospiraceae bacterium XBB1006]|nr:Lysophospholipase L1 [Lachnospiraceae bacterium XBB1006]
MKKRIILSTLVLLLVLTQTRVFAKKNAVAQPTITHVFAYSNGTNVIRWKGVSHATSYEIFRSTKKSNGYHKLATVRTTHAKDTSAKACKGYYYKVRAIGESKGAFSKAVYKKTRKKAKRIAILGDSVASGFDVYHCLQHGEKSYAAVSRRVSTILSKDLGNCISYRPDRVYIMVGTNDCVGNGSTRVLSRSIRSYKRIISRLVSANPNIEIVLMGIGPTRNCSTVTNRTVNRFNRLVKRLTKEKGTIHYFNTPSYLRDSSGSLAANYTGGDGIHWTRSAYKKVYKKLLKFVKKW